MRFWKPVWLTVGLLLLTAIQTSTVLAAPPVDEEGHRYIVQADDWLSRLADKFYGDPLAYPVIVEATNHMATLDSRYISIDNPDLIEIGQSLFIPSNLETAENIMAQAETSLSEPAPTEFQQELLASLAVKGVPPELHNEVWLNSDPLKLANLQGKVVIVEFWTFG